MTASYLPLGQASFLTSMVATAKLINYVELDIVETIQPGSSLRCLQGGTHHHESASQHEDQSTHTRASQPCRKECRQDGKVPNRHYEHLQQLQNHQFPPHTTVLSEIFRVSFPEAEY